MLLFVAMPTVATRPPYSLPEVNAFGEEAFVSAFGSLFEHSPWIARETWPQRPFASRVDLLVRLAATVRGASQHKQIALIAAHPDLAGRLAALGKLTRESTAEQASAGLDGLSSEEMRLFTEYNGRYRVKFGFPFVICARLNDKQAILAAFERRLESSREDEIETALDEIVKIAQLRLESLLPV